MTGMETPMPLRWSDLAWPEIGAIFDARPTDVGLLPVGATEQHGPHLPAGTDTILATAICEAVSARTGAVVLPTVPVGCSYGHGRKLPGTLSLSPEALAAHIRAMVEWVALSGLRRVLVVNAHFGNHASLLVATDHLRLERPELRCGVVGWWSADPEVAAETAADGDDIHANRTETSLMLAVAPGLVHLDRIASVDDPDRTGDLVFRYTATSLSTNGVTGRPSTASADLGRRLLERTVAAIASLVERGRAEEPPLVDHTPSGPPVRPANAEGIR
jgi:creatinine amidohydrolase